MSLGTAELVEMLRRMILIREFDRLAIALRTAGKIYGAVHPYVGEEAVAVGVCTALRVTDRVTSTHRGHGHCIAKGAEVSRMMAELFGRVDGYCKGRGGSMHIADFEIGMLGANGIVGGGLPIASGAALAAQLEGRGTWPSASSAMARPPKASSTKRSTSAQSGTCRSSSCARTTSGRPATPSTSAG